MFDESVNVGAAVINVLFAKIPSFKLNAGKTLTVLVTLLIFPFWSIAIYLIIYVPGALVLTSPIVAILAPWVDVVAPGSVNSTPW